MSNMQSPDEKAISALYEQMMQAWNRGSGEDFAAPMAPDVDFVGFDGTWFKGREEVAASHGALFRTYLKGTRLVGEVTSIRLLSPDVAVMHARGNTIMRGKTRPTSARDSIQTLVAVKQATGWSIAAFQNTRMRPMARNLRSTFLWLIGDWFWAVAIRR
jgi:uncharacterized protein (TIGR02246 family)